MSDWRRKEHPKSIWNTYRVLRRSLSIPYAELIIFDGVLELPVAE